MILFEDSFEFFFLFDLNVSLPLILSLLRKYTIFESLIT